MRAATGTAIVMIATSLLLAVVASAAPLGTPRLTPNPPVPLPSAHHRRPAPRPHGGSASHRAATGAGSHRAATVSPRARGQLPYTGLDAGEELALAGALLAGGVAIAAVTRRRRSF